MSTVMVGTGATTARLGPAISTMGRRRSLATPGSGSDGTGGAGGSSELGVLRTRTSMAAPQPAQRTI
jgi:hypothetical protein